MDDNPRLIPSSDPFEYDPLLLDDELLQFLNGVISPTPQKDDAIPAENRPQDNSIVFGNNNPIGAPPHDLLPRPDQDDNPKAAAATSSKGKRKKKPNATEVERERRHVMSLLYEDLRSLIPRNSNVKRRQSISDLLQDATNHINSLQDGIKKLNDKKERLKNTRSAPDSSTSSSMNKPNQQKPHVTVKPCKEGLIEVIVGTHANCDDNEIINQNVPLSKVIHVLTKEGLNVISCFTSGIGNNLYHNIQAQVDDGRELDLGLLQQTLTNYRYYDGIESKIP